MQILRRRPEAPGSHHVSRKRLTGWWCSQCRRDYSAYVDKRQSSSAVASRRITVGDVSEKSMKDFRMSNSIPL
jgi:hypothetical protein